MEHILFLTHVNQDGSLSKLALETLTSACRLSKELGARLHTGFFGENVQKAVEQTASCGATSVLTVDGADFGVPRYGTDSLAMEHLIKASGATLVLAPATSRMSRSLPGTACRVEGRIDTHVCALETEGQTLHIQRWYYRQRMLASLERKERPWILLVEQGLAEAWQSQGSGTAAEVKSLSVSVPEGLKRTELSGFEKPSADAQTIRPDAKLLFVAGAGWTKKQSDGQPHVKDAEETIKSFLNLSKASLGSSKSLVDLSSEGQAVMSFMSHLNQVGQTGSTPRHPKGLATCCHGEEPHAVGWRFINERRAINLDANCGWAQGKADVLYVADAFAVMKKVNELLGCA